MKTIVVVPGTIDRRKKSWRKTLESVDLTKSNGYCFIGEWLRGDERAELEIGSFILAYDEPGSMKNWNPLLRVFQVEDGKLRSVFTYEGPVGEKTWALAIRDQVAQIINPPKAELNDEEVALLEAFRALTPERRKAVLERI